MFSSGINDRDIRWTFICESCGHENDNIDAYTDGLDVWGFCEVCTDSNNGKLNDD